MKEFSATPAPTELEVEQLTPYLRKLLIFICVASFFEAYDVIIINLALPYLGEEFQADSQALGFAISVISVGTIAAFLPVRLADRYGRRPVLLTVWQEQHNQHNQLLFTRNEGPSPGGHYDLSSDRSLVMYREPRNTLS